MLTSEIKKGGLLVGSIHGMCEKKLVESHKRYSTSKGQIINFLETKKRRAKKYNYGTNSKMLTHV